MNRFTETLALIVVTPFYYLFKWLLPAIRENPIQAIGWAAILGGLGYFGWWLGSHLIWV